MLEISFFTLVLKPTAKYWSRHISGSLHVPQCFPFVTVSTDVYGRSATTAPCWNNPTDNTASTARSRLSMLTAVSGRFQREKPADEFWRGFCLKKLLYSLRVDRGTDNSYQCEAFREMQAKWI